MHPVYFEGAKEIKKPEGMTDEQCSSTWALISQDQQGPFSIQAWKPNLEDLNALNRGEPIYFLHRLPFIPVVALFTLDEKGNPNDE